MATKGDRREVDQNVTEPTGVAQQTPFQRMLRAMEMEATAEVETGHFSGDDLNSILDAETEEELWEAGEAGPLNAQHLSGCEIAIVDVVVKYSRGQANIDTPFVTLGGRKMYFLITAYRLSDAGNKPHTKLPAVGEQFQFNTSARFLAAKIWAFYTRGYINHDTGKVLECMIFGTDLGDGQEVLKLRKVPNRVVRTETV